MALIYIERFMTNVNVRGEGFNLGVNILITTAISIIIISTMIVAFARDDNKEGFNTFVQIFNTIASKNLIAILALVFYILFMTNTEKYDNNFNHPIMDKIGLGKIISNRTLCTIMMFISIFMTSMTIHKNTMNACSNPTIGIPVK
jgi:hypothetical protein